MNETQSKWQPTWTFQLPNNDGSTTPFGLVIDDHCLVGLAMRPEGWKPTPWIPRYVAEAAAKLIADGLMRF